MPRHDPHTLRPPATRRGPRNAAVLLILALAVALGGWWWWSQRTPPAPVTTQAAAPAAAPAPAASAAAPADAASAPQGSASAPLHPLPETAPPAAGLPPLDSADAQVTAALAELLGTGPVQSLLQTDGFVRRIVATVDNLPRERAPARLWPVQPTPQRFLVTDKAGITTIATANAARYGALLSFAEAIPLDRAVKLYGRLYPLFQQAYEELGYPGRYFNDRLVAVIDHLLQAPEPKGPLEVRLFEVRGQFSDPRPWVRYEYTDPTLQSLSGGQKIMVRMGMSNERRAKTLLAQLRRLLAKGPVQTMPGPTLAR